MGVGGAVVQPAAVGITGITSNANGNGNGSINAETVGGAETSAVQPFLACGPHALAQQLQTQQQMLRAPVFTTPAVNGTAFSSSGGVGGGGGETAGAGGRGGGGGEEMNPAVAAVAAAMAAAMAAAGMGCVPFPVQSFLQLNPVGFRGGHLALASCVTVCVENTSSNKCEQQLLTMHIIDRLRCFNFLFCAFRFIRM